MKTGELTEDMMLVLALVLNLILSSSGRDICAKFGLKTFNKNEKIYRILNFCLLDLPKLHKDSRLGNIRHLVPA